MSAKHTRSGALRNSARAPQQRSAPRSNPVLPLPAWCTQFCNQAHGVGVITGLNNLGPVNSFSDLLVASSSASPQTIVAAEQIIHMIEGWRYASAAVSAYLSHSKGTATHFAYYAELRAAMSLFAWSGMRIKQYDYFLLDGTGNKVDFANHPTHKTVWELWQRWTQRTDTKDLFNNRIYLYPGVTLGNVLSALQYVSPKTTLQQWGMDLLEVSNDHKARNHSSYEAHWTSSPLTLMPTANAELIREIWKLFLIDGSNILFDRAIICHFVNLSLTPMMGLSGLTAENQKSLIASQISNSTGSDRGAIERQLDSSSFSTEPFLLAASSSSDTENVLCRAFFLLRMAMLALKASLSLTSNDSAKNWIEHWLTHAGIWSNSQDIELQDVEEDYRLAVHSFSPVLPLPNSIWDGSNLPHVARLVRPDACIAWGLIA